MVISAVANASDIVQIDCAVDVHVDTRVGDHRRGFGFLVCVGDAGDVGIVVVDFIFVQDHEWRRQDR